MTHEAVLRGSYDYRLVALSAIIAVASAYAALDLGGRVSASRGHIKAAWLAGGAIAMGVGIWAMHYIGMLAYSLPIPVLYDFPTVVVSLLAAVLASAVALFVVSRNRMTPSIAGIGGLFMGCAIAAMHYIGMEAMRLPAMCHYSRGILILSVVIAVVISLIALWLTFRVRSETHSITWRKLYSALVMGAAIPIMHYTGMAAVSFTPMPLTQDLSNAVGISALGTFGIATVTLVVLGLAIITSLVDRRFSQQALELDLSEQRYRQLVESAKVILWRSDSDVAGFTFVNQEAEVLLGYPQSRWLDESTFLFNHLHPEDRALVESHCKAAAQDREPHWFEHRILTSRGDAIWLRTSVRLLSGTSTNELVGVMTDITERKHAEEKAEEASQAKGRLLAEIERLNGGLLKENSRMSAELDVTRRLQQMMLPRDADIRGLTDMDIAGFMEPASEVGGDYYDVIPSDGGVVIGIGDVTGHGLESGVIAIMVQTAVRTLLASGLTDSRRFFELLNRVVYENARQMNCDRNLTFSLLHYQDKHVVISGQHEEVLIVRNNGQLERHDTFNLGFPIGLEKDISQFVGETRVPLETGDVMVLYTDGITEAANSAGATYGLDRLSKAIVDNHLRSADGIREAVLSNLRQYIGDQSLFDDISLLVVKPA